MEKIEAAWSISLDCTCPHCKEYVDLLDYCDFWDSRRFGPCENRTPETQGVSVVCPKCTEEFDVDLVY